MKGKVGRRGGMNEYKSGMRECERGGLRRGDRQCKTAL